MKRVKTYSFFLIISIGFFLVGSVMFANLVLPEHGRCIKAVLTDQTTRVRSSKATLIYRFQLNGKVYDGNSLETDLMEEADSVCVVYFGMFPSINRPAKYFNNTNLKCKCE